MINGSRVQLSAHVQLMVVHVTCVHAKVVSEKRSLRWIEVTSNHPTRGSHYERYHRIDPGIGAASRDRCKTVAQSCARRSGGHEFSVGFTGLRDGLRQWISSAQHTPEAERPCVCDYQRTRPETGLSVFGRVTYKRADYAGCTWNQSGAPLDEEYDLQAGHVSAGLAELPTLARVELAVEHSCRWLNGFWLFEVSENTIRQETQALG